MLYLKCYKKYLNLFFNVCETFLIAFFPKQKNVGRHENKIQKKMHMNSNIS